MYYKNVVIIYKFFKYRLGKEEYIKLLIYKFGFGIVVFFFMFFIIFFRYVGVIICFCEIKVEMI